MTPSIAKDLQRVARWFHALSDETRLKIVDRLSNGEQCVCDLTDALETGQSRLSFHLKTLKDAGILTDRHEGRWTFYALNPDAIEEIGRYVSLLKEQRSRVRDNSECCD